jgi:DNA topoisomerase IB
MPRLKRVEPYSPGFTRVRRGRGFIYVHTDGGVAGRAERARIADLAVPASTVLGNTPAIAKASYVDPRVFAEYERGRLISRRGVREAALLALFVEDE